MTVLERYNNVGALAQCDKTSGSCSGRCYVVWTVYLTLSCVDEPDFRKVE